MIQQQVKNGYKKSNYEVLDILVNELKRRFHQNSLAVLHELEDILITSKSHIISCVTCTRVTLISID